MGLHFWSQPYPTKSGSGDFVKLQRSVRISSPFNMGPHFLLGIGHKRVYPVLFSTKMEVEYVHYKQYIFCGFDASSGLNKTSGRYLNREYREGTHILTSNSTALVEYIHLAMNRYWTLYGPKRPRSYTCRTVALAWPLVRLCGYRWRWNELCP